MKWNQNALRSLNIEDRRQQHGSGTFNASVAPSEADSLAYGLPQTPKEVQLMKRRIAQADYYREHGTPMPDTTPDNVVRAKPTEGDPAGIEARRRMWERFAAMEGRAQPVAPMPQPAPAGDERVLDVDYLNWLASQRRRQ